MLAQPDLRPFQKEALARLKPPRAHLLCVAPTGSGKSRIFQELLRSSGARALLISPLVALARQHEYLLCTLGIKASTTFDPETQVWILSPESLLLEQTWERLLSYQPELLIVDECHCLWEWGEQFRPAFQDVPKLLGLPSMRRSLWLTATLTREHATKLSQLCEEHADHALSVMGGFEFPSRLQIAIRECEGVERMGTLLNWIEINGSSGIVFCPTRESARRLARSLHAARIASALYHAGLSREERQGIEARLRNGDRLVVIATSAFGMGMDFPQLDWAVLFGAPTSVLALAQAVGRVGRADRDGHARILWSPWDFELLRSFLPSTPDQMRALREVSRMLRLKNLSSSDFRQTLL